jgi:hypothetical protein
VAAAGFAAASDLMLAPVTASALGAPLFLVFLAGPAYRLHQIEEHVDDRFRRFINDRLFGGRDALTEAGVLWINLPGVWGVNALSLIAGWFVAPGWGLAAGWLMLINALVHVAAAVRLRVYNPGLITALLLLLPLGVAIIWRVPASPVQQASGMAVAVAIHVLIVIYIKLRAARLAAPC